VHQNQFIPVTFLLKLSLPEETNLERWGKITALVLESYAKTLTKGEGVYIGHIKALFEGDGSDYIKLSIYKEDIPVGVEISGQNNYSTVQLTVNSIVCGVDEEMSLDTMRDVFNEYRNLLIDYEIESISEHHDDHHEHHDHHDHCDHR